MLTGQYAHLGHRIQSKMPSSDERSREKAPVNPHHQARPTSSATLAAAFTREEAVARAQRSGQNQRQHCASDCIRQKDQEVDQARGEAFAWCLSLILTYGSGG